MPGPMCFVIGCLAQVAVIFINGLVIWVATLVTGEGEWRFRVALKTSFIEIITLYIINGVLLGALFTRALIGYLNEGRPIMPFIPLEGSFVPFLILNVVIDLVNIILIVVILTFLIRGFYKYEILRALKATGIVVLIDFMLGVSICFLLWAVGVSSVLWWP
jgi:hypothetical protein